MIYLLQVILHLWGDYIFQSQWMAERKGFCSIAAAAHVVCYTVPFYIASQYFDISWSALIVIAGTHFLIDRLRLARYVVYAKNVLGSLHERNVYVQCKTYIDTDYEISEEVRKWSWTNCCDTGYPKQMPSWMSVWLTIVADNTIHLTINLYAISCL